MFYSHLNLSKLKFLFVRPLAADDTVDEEAEREEEEGETGLIQTGVFGQNPTVPEVGLAPSREPLQPSVEEDEEPEQRGNTFKGEEAL